MKQRAWVILIATGILTASVGYSVPLVLATDQQESNFNGYGTFSEPRPITTEMRQESQQDLTVIHTKFGDFTTTEEVLELPSDQVVFDVESINVKTKAIVLNNKTFVK